MDASADWPPRVSVRLTGWSPSQSITTGAGHGTPAGWHVKMTVAAVRCQPAAFGGGSTVAAMRAPEASVEALQRRLGKRTRQFVDTAERQDFLDEWFTLVAERSRLQHVLFGDE